MCEYPCRRCPVWHRFFFFFLTSWIEIGKLAGAPVCGCSFGQRRLARRASSLVPRGRGPERGDTVGPGHDGRCCAPALTPPMYRGVRWLITRYPPRTRGARLVSVHVRSPPRAWPRLHVAPGSPDCFSAVFQDPANRAPKTDSRTPRPGRLVLRRSARRPAVYA